MKKLNVFIAVLIMMIVFPSLVKATGEVTVSKSDITMAKGRRATFTINASNAIGKISIVSDPDVTLSVNANAENSNPEENSYWIENEELQVTVESDTIGTSEITITLVDVSTDEEEPTKLTNTYVVNLTVSDQTEAHAESIVIETMPDKLQYVKGSTELDLTGGKMIVKYDDGTEEVINMTLSDLTIAEFNTDIVGTSTVVLIYDGVRFQYDIEVIEDPKGESQDIDSPNTGINETSVMACLILAIIGVFVYLKFGRKSKFPKA